MAFLAPVFAALGRFAGRILTTTLGWASTLLFGRVAESRQIWLAALTFGSLAWVALVVGVVVPSAGTFLLGFIPLPSWVDEGLVRLAMLVAAIVLPALLGLLSVLVADPSDRARGAALVVSALRGYPLAPALAATLVVLGLAGIVRKADSLLHRRRDTHIPMVVRPGRYEPLVETVEAVLRREGLVDRRVRGSRVLTVPAKLLAAIAGGGFRRLVPSTLVELRGPDLKVDIYPSDLAMSGTRDASAAARGLVARDLRSQDAWFTTSEMAQALEDRLVELERRRVGPGDPALDAVDRELLDLTVPQDEWEVLYRRRLQLVTPSGEELGREGGVGDPGPGEGEAGIAGLEAPSRTSLVGALLAALVLVDLVLVALRGDPTPDPTSVRERYRLAAERDRRRARPHRT